MSWSAEYRLPEPRQDPERLKALLVERIAKLDGGSLAYFGGNDDPRYLAAGVAFTRGGRAYQGCIEWWFDSDAREQAEHAISAGEIEDRLGDQTAEGDDDEEPTWATNAWVPGRFEAFVSAAARTVDVVGTGRGILNVGSSWAGATPVVPESVVANESFQNEEAALVGVVRDGTTEWAFGYRGLLLRRDAGVAWSHVPLALPEGTSVTGVLPRGDDERWLLTDVGGVWRLNDAGVLTRIDGVPDTEDYPGGTSPLWSMVARGDEVWIANGTTAIYALSARGARSIPMDDVVQRLCVDAGGSLWVAGNYAVWTGDGDRFERVLQHDETEQRVDALLTPRRGGVLVFSTPARWPRKTPGRFVRLGGDAETIDLAVDSASAVALATDDDYVVWLARDDRGASLYRVDLPVPMSTRMTVRSNRDDNREDECWYAMTELAASMSAALGGTDVTS